jgi:hypothetical protein|tara:strand:+ start:4209 stop:4883 length:675 start_codon:yes stop_codon:yes gene_type:complete
MKEEESEFVLGLDISTKTIGIALYKNLGDKGELTLLTHVTPKIKPVPPTKTQELFEKCNIFESEFLNKYKDLNITKVIIEEPLLRSNNVNTVGTLLRFNGMISRSVYQKLGIVPDFISSFDARAYAFPELMAIRTHNKKGVKYPEKEIKKKINEDQRTLFGAYDWEADKKTIVWEKVADLYPQINWMYTRNHTLSKENFDMTDAACAVLGCMNKEDLWLAKDRK